MKCNQHGSANPAVFLGKRGSLNTSDRPTTVGSAACSQFNVRTHDSVACLHYLTWMSRQSSRNFSHSLVSFSCSATLSHPLDEVPYPEPAEEAPLSEVTQVSSV